MAQKTSNYSIATAISLLLLFCLAMPTVAQQQQQGYLPHVPKRDQKKNEVKEPKEEIPLYYGTVVGIEDRKSVV